MAFKKLDIFNVYDETKHFSILKSDFNGRMDITYPGHCMYQYDCEGKREDRDQRIFPYMLARRGVNGEPRNGGIAIDAIFFEMATAAKLFKEFGPALALNSASDAQAYLDEGLKLYFAGRDGVCAPLIWIDESLTEKFCYEINVISDDLCRKYGIPTPPLAQSKPAAITPK